MVPGEESGEKSALSPLSSPGTTEGYLNRKRAPLLERNPAAFWRGISLLLAVAVVVLLAT